MMKAKVKFIPQNIELEIDPDQSVMELAHKNNIFIKSVCNGLPSCAECRVRLIEGEHNVMQPFEKELGLIGTGHFVDQRRLSCQLHCYGDITVDLSEQVEKEKSGPRKPQGSQKSEGEESYAVAGNLIEQEQKSMAQLSTSEGHESREPSSGNDFYSELHQSASTDGGPTPAGSGEKSGRSRNRNRNRNRNKNRHKKNSNNRNSSYRPKD